MNSVIVLQARTSSTRLPGKVLLPINGVPLVVLAAKRASNTGRTLIVTTSLDHSDDGLVALIQSYGLRCFRGSLENTLSRIVNALCLYDDQTVVFRLTADNIFPDGALLDELEAEFLTKNLEYLCCNGEQSGLPYGLSAEVTRLGHLREAAHESVLALDLEHVTPYVIRKHGATYFQKYLNLKLGHFRCTIDCMDDYLCIQQIFSNVVDPVQVPAFELVRGLEKAPLQPLSSAATPKLVFGTAQLGGEYGIANATGQPSKRLCEELIKTAIANGVAYLDTASVYGSSEATIGQALKNGWVGRAKVITKLSPLQDCPPAASASILHAFVDSSIFKSCSALRVQKLDVLMLHRATHLVDWNGGVWQRLLELKASGVIDELGASIQNPEELLMALEMPEVKFIQLPFNLFDWRWDAVIPKILEAKASRKLFIHVRSAMLQGLLPSDDKKLWDRANVEHSVDVRDWLLNQVAACQRINVVDLCLNYVNGLAWVDGIATGMENMAQLEENIVYFNRPPLTESQIKSLLRTRPTLGEATLNPTLWRK